MRTTRIHRYSIPIVRETPRPAPEPPAVALTW
jgi:hypothetical protein